MNLRKWWERLVAATSALFITTLAYAQQGTDATTSSGNNTTTSTTTVWYGQWYIWVGVALFVIIVIALTNRGSGTRSS